MKNYIPAKMDLLEIQQAIRSLWQTVSFIDDSGNINMHGRRFLNAGESILPGDFVTRRELTGISEEIAESVYDEDLDTSVPDSNMVITVSAVGAFAALITVEKPSGQTEPAGWRNVTKIELQVARDPGFTDLVYVGEKVGRYTRKSIFTFVTEEPNQYYAHARATNLIGTGGWSGSEGFQISGISDEAKSNPPTIDVIISRMDDGKWRVIFGAEYPTQNNLSVTRTRFQISRNDSFTDLVCDVVLSAPDNFVWITGELVVYYFRACCYNSEGWSDWSATIRRGLEDAYESDDEAVPSAPANVQVYADDFDESFNGKELMVEFDRPEYNWIEVWAYAVQVHDSSTFPSHIQFASGTCVIHRNSLILTDNNKTFSPSLDGKTLWMHTDPSLSEASLRSTAKVMAVTEHTLQLSMASRMESDEQTVYYQVITPDWEQVIRSETVLAKREQDGVWVGAHDHYQKVITGLANGTYWARVKAVNGWGLGPWSDPQPPTGAVIDGFDTKDFKGQSVTAAKLAGDARAQHGVFFETFEAFPTGWFQVTSSGVQSIVDGQGQAGGKIYRSTGWDWRVFPSNIPYDSSKLYRMRCRIRRTSPGTAGLFYIGVTGIAADGVTKVSTSGADQWDNQHYICACAVSPTDGVWTEYTGWFKGWNATGGGVPSTDPTDPKPLHSNVRYVRPLMILNYNAGTETADIDEIAIDVFDEEGVDRTYTAIKTDGNINTGKVITDSILNDAVTTAKIINAAITQGKLADACVATEKLINDAVTTLKLNNLAVTEAKIADLAVATAKIIADAITETKIADNAVTTPQLLAGSVTSGKISVSYLSAIAGDLGSITAGHIVGGDIKTAGSGECVELTAGGLRCTDGASNLFYADMTGWTVYAYEFSADSIEAGTVSTTYYVDVGTDIDVGGVYKMDGSNVINSSRAFVGSGGVDTDGDVDAGSGKAFKIAGTAVLDAAYCQISTGYYIGANQVVGARGSAVADASGGSTVDAEARAAINSLLSRLRTHGLIAS